MARNTLTRNALMAVTQVVSSGVILILIYGYLLRILGSEQLGIWSLVLATASITKISELGFTGSAVKFTAKYIALRDNAKAVDVILTTFVSIAVVLGVILSLCYPLFAFLLEVLIPSHHLVNALVILPYALVSVWISAIAGVLMSGLDGCQRIDLRAMVTIAASITFLVLVWILAPIFGLKGLAWAQVVQGFVLLFSALVLLRRELPSLPMLPLRWHYSLFREMLNYGINFQVISIVRMLFDPTTKLLLTSFGGLSATAYYEMANRMVIQFRSLIVSANQVLVPRVADLHEISPNEISKIYLNTYRIVFFMALPLYSGIIAIIPVISVLWIGRYEHDFVWYSMLLVIGYLYNTLISPAYFINLGTGILRWNMWAHISIGVINILLGYLLGTVFGGVGVVMGYALALIIGSSIVVVSYHHIQNIPLYELFPHDSILLSIACCVGLLAGWSAYHYLPSGIINFVKNGLSIFICMVIIAPVIWVHPMRKFIFKKITSVFSR